MTPGSDRLAENLPAPPTPEGQRLYRYSTAKDSAPAQGLPSTIQWNRIWIGLAAAAMCFLALYPYDLLHLLTRWFNDSAWSHGFVVPLIGLFFVRLKWDTLRRLTPGGSPIGLPILIVGVIGQVLFRATGLLHMSDLSILVVLLGGVLFIFGWQYLKMLWLPIGYLGFAIPPPAPLYVAMTTPMQTTAATLGVLLLGLFGTSAQQRGNVIDVYTGSLKPMELDVAEACSGMKMLVAFFALAVALAYSTTRPMWQKVFLAVCALPIAILCNGLRVALTGFMGAHYGQQWAEGKTHEYVGLFMLIPALFLQLTVAWILDRIFIETPENPAPAGGGA